MGKKPRAPRERVRSMRSHPPTLWGSCEMRERGPHNGEKTSCAQRAGEINEVPSSNSLGFLRNARTVSSQWGKNLVRPESGWDQWCPILQLFGVLAKCENGVLTTGKKPRVPREREQFIATMNCSSSLCLRCSVLLTLFSLGSTLSPCERESLSSSLLHM